MKPFLYLVQSRLQNLERYQNLEKYQSLESESSDVMYLTFEEKVDKPNYLYAPNTCWARGRDCLIEAAKKLDRRYEYYIMLDDDVEFVGENGFRKFEEEVLEVKPDFAIPIYFSHEVSRRYAKLIEPLIQRNIFRCSHIVYFDSTFICLSRELLFDKEILPYRKEYFTSKDFENSYAESYSFSLNLFEYHNHRKLYVINKVKVINTQHISVYSENYTDQKLKDKIKEMNSNYKFIMEKELPALQARQVIDGLIAFLDRRRTKFTQDSLRRKIPEWLTYRILVKLVWWPVFFKAFVRDIRLAYQMRKESKRKH